MPGVENQSSVSSPDFVLSGKVDPFSSFSIDVSPAVLEQLQYFGQFWAQNAFRCPLTRKETLKDEEEVFEIIRGGLTDEMRIYTILATACMRMLLVQGSTGCTATSKPQMFAAKALTAFRKQLMSTEKLPPERALDILLLASYEIYCFDVEGARTHLRALQSTNSEAYLQGYARRLAVAIDLFVATACLQLPILNTTHEYFRNVHADEIFSGVAFSEIGTSDQGFQRHESLFERDTFAVIKKITHCGRITQLYYRDPEHFLATKDIAEHLILWADELSYRLACCWPQSEAAADPFVEAVMIALLMWLSYLPTNIMAHVHTSATTDSQRKILPGRGSALCQRMRKLGPRIATFGEHEVGLILWLATVGMVCSVDSDDVEHCASWFIGAAQRLGIGSQEDLGRRLGQYLCLENFDFVDYELMFRLTVEETRQEAFLRAIDWASVTKVAQEADKNAVIRVTMRPSNQYRLGA